MFLLSSVNAIVRDVVDPGDSIDIQPHILQVYNTANNGDVINLPPGIFVFNKNIVIRKLISFKGAGIGKTILYRSESVPDDSLNQDNGSWTGMLKFVISKTTPSNIVVSDITFKSKYPSIVQGDTGSLAKDIGIVMFKSVDFIITRCRFEYFGRAAVSVDHTDSLAGGLICNNEFYHNSKGFDGNELGYGVEVYGDNDKWIDSVTFGSNNFIFIEDNIFDHHRHAIAAGGAGLYVARHNNIINSFIYHAVDTHDGKGGTPSNGNFYSTRAIEVYNNIITNTKYRNGNLIDPGNSIDTLTERAIAIRGAEAVVFNNTISGFRFGCGINIVNKPADSLYKYPIPYTTGFKSGELFGASHTGIYADSGKGDLFYWNNSFTPRISDTSSKNLANYQPEYFKLNRDFHTVAKPGYNSYTYPHPLKSIMPNKPIVDAITQPSCDLVTGSVVLSGLPAGNWILYPDSISGTGASYTVTGLSPGIHNFIVTNASGHNSAPTSDVVINSHLALQSKIKLYIEGFYNSGTNKMISDTVSVFLRSIVNPYSLIDSAKAKLDSSGSGDFIFKNASAGKYYLQVISRNGIETWSRSGGDSLKSCSLFTYDFTNALNKAFGNNMIQVDDSPLSFAVYSGDINKDGIVDAGDLSSVENDAAISLTGYIISDLNGDNFADASDLSIVENNLGAGVAAP